MAVDIEQHEANKMKFLEVLYNMERDHIASSPNASPSVIIGGKVYAIGDSVGFTKLDSQRLYSELKDDGHLVFMGSGEGGSSCSLTNEGRLFIERYLYEKSPLARRRKRKKWLMDKAAELAKIGAGKLLAGIGTFLLSALAIYRVEAIAWAIRHILGK